MRRHKGGKWLVGGLNLFAVGSLSFDQAQELLTALPPLRPRVPTTELWAENEPSSLVVKIEAFLPPKRKTQITVESEPLRSSDGATTYYMTVGSLLWNAAREYRRIASDAGIAMHDLEIVSFTLNGQLVTLEVAR